MGDDEGCRDGLADAKVIFAVLNARLKGEL